MTPAEHSPGMGEAELNKLKETAERVERLEHDLEEARGQLRRDVRRAHESGESVSELARRLGVTRTRVYQLLRD